MVQIEPDTKRDYGCTGSFEENPGFGLTGNTEWECMGEGSVFVRWIKEEEPYEPRGSRMVP